MSRKYHLSIVVTNKCNLNCVYCYENSKTNNCISVDRAKQIIEQKLTTSDYDEVIIDFFGGEPFIEFEKIKEICEWTWSKKWSNKYLFFATTNGVLVHGHIQSWLREHSRQFWVSLSLDGTPENHNINRSNSYSHIDIPFFRECWPEQTIKMTISKETISSIYENIIHIHSLGFNLTGTNFAEGIDWSDPHYVQIVKNQLELLCEFYIKNPDIKVPPILNMRLFKCEQNNSPFKWCGTGEHMCALNTDGKLYPCTFFTPMTFDEEKLSLIQSVDFKNYSSFEDRECSRTCYLHPICNNCYGANLLSTGKLNCRDKSCCNLIKLRAYFTAALLAHKILANPTDSIETQLTIKAIERIKKEYEELAYPKS